MTLLHTPILQTSVYLGDTLPQIMQVHGSVAGICKQAESDGGLNES